ncbi:LON peptidase N-terminal domain and RING finger protein 3-like [Glandiceps talaboti]
MDVAREAFISQNFDVAAQIYSRLLREHGPNMDFYLAKGDSEARAGNLDEAFNSYAAAFELGNVSSDRLTHLVTGFVEIISKKEGLSAGTYQKESLDMFSCLICHSLLYEPVTLPCGHTFCKLCLQKLQTRTCKKCNVHHAGLVITTLKLNVELSNLLEKYFANESKACKTKAIGNQLFSEEKYLEAVEKYSEALTLVPRDHLLASNRSHAYATLGNYQDALKDSDRACELRPDWPKGHYRKGSALLGLGRNEEAMIAFLQCLVLDPSNTSARKELAKVLHSLLSPLPAENLKRSELSHHMLNTVRPPFGAPLPYAAPIMEDNVEKNNASSSDIMDTSESTELDKRKHPDFSALLKVADTEVDALKEVSSPSMSSSSSSSTRSRLSLSSAVIEIGKRKRNDLSPLSSPIKTHFKFSKIEVRPRTPREVKPEMIDKSDYECSLCFRLYYQPVTTPCGHMFCRNCLDRCLDHNNKCPLCKHSLIEYLAERREATTEIMEKMVVKFLPQELEERKKLHEAEMEELANYANSDSVSEIPVFVCTLAYPTIPCPLHIFEPRYRLMVRRCLETGARQFGMCLPNDQTGFAEYGCMLEVRDVQFFPDGRSVIDAIGGRRFKVLDRGVRDGYHTAKVEFLKDKAVENEEELAELKALHDAIYDEAKTWFQGLRGVIKGRIENHFGSMPPKGDDLQTAVHGPRWTWWLLAVLPLDSRAQMTVLSMASLKDRLLALRRVLNYVSRQGSS